MHPLTKWAAKLYPRWWRERYGEEFAVLLEDARPGLAGALDIAKGALAVQMTTWSSKRIIALGGLLGLLFAWGLIQIRPVQYSSRAVISVVSPHGEQAMVDAVNVAALDAFSRNQLTGLVRALDLYKEERQRQTLEDILENMRRNIRINPEPSDHGVDRFSVRFQNEDPIVARTVTNRLISMLIDSNVRSRGASQLTMELREAPQPGEVVSPTGWWKLGAVGAGIGVALSGLLSLLLRLRHKRD